MCAHFCVNKTHTAEVTMGKQSLQVIFENVCWQREKDGSFIGTTQTKSQIDMSSYPERG